MKRCPDDGIQKLANILCLEHLYAQNLITLHEQKETYKQQD